MKRALTLLAPALLAIGLVACGDDDDSPDTTEATAETTEPPAATVTETSVADGEDTESGGAVTDDQADTMAQVFPNLSGDQIDCLVDELGDATTAMDAAQAQAAADACGIDPADLVPDLSAITIPDDISIPDNMDEILAQVFPTLDDEQIDCLVSELGADFDLAEAANMAETCNIDASDMQPGG